MYIALRSMKVDDEDGNTRQVKPGDEIPEAEGWKTRKAYVNRGWICLKDGALNDAATARLTRLNKDQSETIARLEKEILELQRYEPAVVTASSAPIATSKISLEHSKGIATTDLLSYSETDEDPKLTKQELNEMSKDSLMTLASSMNINPGQSGKKLVKAIFANQ